MASHGIFAFYMMAGIAFGFGLSKYYFHAAYQPILPKCTFYYISNFINKTNYVVFHSGHVRACRLC